MSGYMKYVKKNCASSWRSSHDVPIGQNLVIQLHALIHVRPNNVGDTPIGTKRGNTASFLYSCYTMVWASPPTRDNSSQ